MSDNEVLNWPYSVLELDHIPQDQKTIKRAYARKLKQIDQVSQAGEFQELREAYEAALAWLKYDEDVENEETQPDEYIGHQEVNLEVPNKELDKSGQTYETILSPNKYGKEPSDFEVLNSLSDQYQGSETFSKPHAYSAEQEAEKVDENRLYWKLIYEKCDELSEDFRAEGFEEKIKSLIGEPIFVDPEAMHYLENQIFSCLLSKIRTDKRGRPFFKRSEVSPTLLEFLDQKYNWLSDYIGLQQRFGDVQDFIIAASNLIGVTETFVEPKKKKSWRSFHQNASRSIRNPITVAISFIWAIISCGIAFKQFTSNSGEELSLIFIPYALLFTVVLGLLIFVILATFHYLLLAALYFINFDKLSDYLFSLKFWLLWGALFFLTALIAPFMHKVLLNVVFFILMLYPTAVVIGFLILVLTALYYIVGFFIVMLIGLIREIQGRVVRRFF